MFQMISLFIRSRGLSWPKRTSLSGNPALCPETVNLAPCNSEVRLEQASFEEHRGSNFSQVCGIIFQSHSWSDWLRCRFWSERPAKLRDFTYSDCESGNTITPPAVWPISPPPPLSLPPPPQHIHSAAPASNLAAESLAQLAVRPHDCSCSSCCPIPIMNSSTFWPLLPTTHTHTHTLWQTRLSWAFLTVWLGQKPCEPHLVLLCWALSPHSIGS